MAIRLSYKEILQNDAQIHLARAVVTSVRPKSLHDHDFYELLWVQNGKVRHHLPGGVTTLSEGDVLFIGPSHRHALQGKGEHAMVVSITIHPETVEAIAQRHPSLAGHLFWTDTGPMHITRDIRQLATLNHAAVLLERSACDTLAAEAFLLPLCAELIRDGFSPEVPGWLAKACADAQDPTVFRQGSAGLVALTGKAHPHVSRSMRRYLGMTPSDYVNDLRMSYAARALITDADPVSQIAADCGIPNMSHFHKLFRAAHGITPLQYRQKFQRDVVQPQ